MLRITTILGYAAAPEIAERLHTISHAAGLETLLLDRADAKRHRLRATTDSGTDVAIALRRDEYLSDGAVLYLEDDKAIVVRMTDETWLTFCPLDTSAALELGYLAGNMHWRVKFSNSQILIAKEGPEDEYLDRLVPFLTSGRVKRVEHD